MRRWLQARLPVVVLSAAALDLLSGCARAPAFNILGSFFPGWIACIALGILLTVVVRFVLQRLNIERQLIFLPLVYTSLAILFGSLLWLLFFE